MFEKVSADHPDKVADRIGGAMVDLAYEKDSRPKIAVEVLIGHGECYIIAETSVHFDVYEVASIVERIAGNVTAHYIEVPQDVHLAGNQEGRIRCGDNGIFKGVPVTNEQRRLSDFARDIYREWPYDGKYILDGGKLTICHSNAKSDDLLAFARDSGFDGEIVVNPLGDWTGGPVVDTGAINRKLGSDMGDAVTGGGITGKDASKADVSVNIYAHLKAQELGEPVLMSCSIGDEEVCGIPYDEIVETALNYVRSLGGFEKLAEWGLV